ncbi:MAG: cyclase family protein [Bryobacteraceae bacterium]|nr:cyclase family protein [Bryobacteraceae bacterium]
MKLTVCAVLLTAVSAPAQVRIDEKALVDLTYAFDEKTIYWPTDMHFQWKQTHAEMTPGGYWYASATYGASEHGGTHIDSPVHFARGARTLEQIPLSELVRPAVVIDIAAKCAANPDYELTADDIAAWENRHGRIPAGSIALARTGWGRFWPDKKKYLGSDKPGDVANLHFPGLSEGAAKLLVERKIAGAGIDTASIDPGTSKTFPVHQVLYAANLYGLENVANLEKLPATGATLIVAPMKIKGGTGGPARIIAIVP